MIYTDVTFNRDSEQKLMEGVRVMAQAVGSTLGPQGRNVAIGYAGGKGEIWQRIVVHDGVTVAKSIHLLDLTADMGAQLLKQAAQKQVQDVGDGTTVSIILAHAILEEFQALTAAGINPMKLRRYLEEAVSEVIEGIRKEAIPVKTLEQMVQIATISSEDDRLGKMVADVMQDMGPDGMVAVEESKNTETTVEKQEGLQLDKGYISQYFVTNPEKMEAILDNPLILVTDIPINTLVEMQKLLEAIATNHKSIVVFTPSMGMDAMGSMIVNKRNGIIPSIVIQAPSFGQNQKNVLEDIAIVTGASFISEESGWKLKDVTIEQLGKCEYVNATKNETIIVGGKGDKKAIEARVEGIRQTLRKEEIDYDRTKLEERLAKLTSGVAVIKAGGATEVEMKERRERIDDAVKATRAAIKTGIVPGGEVIYLLTRQILKQTSLGNEKSMAYQLLYKALYKPFAKLLSNAGLNDGEYYAYLEQKDNHKLGIDVMDGTIKDLIKSGIIDPSAVPINALQNATSVAVQIATTGCTIIQKIEGEEK